MVLFRVFGVVDVRTPAGEGAISAEKPRRVLSVLLLRANCWVTDGELIDAVWPGEPPASAPGNLKTYISRLRQALGRIDQAPGRIERKSGAYRLTVGRDELDTLAFEDLVVDGRAALDEGEPAVAIGRLSEALRLWHGRPFQSLELEAAQLEATRLAELRWTARQGLADAYVRAGQDEKAVALLRPMTAENPLSEHTWLRLMEVLANLGRRAEALEAYLCARSALVDELGVEPGTELRESQVRILRAETPARTRPEAPMRATAAPRPTRTTELVYLDWLRTYRAAST